MIRKRLRKAALFILLITAFYSCAQQKSVVKKLSSFSMEKLPGTIMKNEKGDPVPAKPITLVLVFAETKSNEVLWDTAWFEHKAWKLIPAIAEKGLFEVGLQKMNDEKVVIKADSGFFLYQLYLEPIDRSFALPAQYEEGKILLKGRYRNHVFYRKAETPRQIRAFDAM